MCDSLTTRKLCARARETTERDDGGRRFITRVVPTGVPTPAPSYVPSVQPSHWPSAAPTLAPSSAPPSPPPTTLYYYIHHATPNPTSALPPLPVIVSSPPSKAPSTPAPTPYISPAVCATMPTPEPTHPVLNVQPKPSPAPIYVHNATEEGDAEAMPSPAPSATASPTSMPPVWWSDAIGELGVCDGLGVVCYHVVLFVVTALLVCCGLCGFFWCCRRRRKTLGDYHQLQGGQHWAASGPSQGAHSRRMPWD